MARESLSHCMQSCEAAVVLSHCMQSCEAAVVLSHCMQSCEVAGFCLGWGGENCV